MEPFPDELNKELSLSEWILKFDKHLLSHPSFYEYVKEYFFESYKNASKLRKEFHTNFIPKLESELGFPSSREFYKYENFFKPINYPKFDLAQFYFYNEDLNLLKQSRSSTYKKSKGNNSGNNLKNRKIICKRNTKKSDINDDKEENNDIENNIGVEIDSIGNKKKIERIKPLKRKSNKNDSNNSLKSEFSNNEDDEDESLSDFNMETYGKQIDDSEENSESKLFQISKRSSKKNKNNNRKNSHKSTKIKKLNFTKSSSNIGRKEIKPFKKYTSNYISLKNYNNLQY